MKNSESPDYGLFLTFVSSRTCCRASESADVNAAPEIISSKCVKQGILLISTVKRGILLISTVKRGILLISTVKRGILLISTVNHL